MSGRLDFVVSGTDYSVPVHTNRLLSMACGAGLSVNVVVGNNLPCPQGPLPWTLRGCRSGSEERIHKRPLQLVAVVHMGTSGAAAFNSIKQMVQ